MIRLVRVTPAVAVLGAVALSLSVSACGTGEAPAAAATGQTAPPQPPPSQTSPLVTSEGEVLVACRGGVPFRPSVAADGGAQGLADPAAVERALDAMGIEAGGDGPQALAGVSAAQAGYVVLGGQAFDGVEHLSVLVGPWDPVTSPRHGDHLILVAGGDGWTVAGGGGCHASPVLTEGLAWAEIRTATGAPEPQSTLLQVEVSESECVSGRDPEPYLQDPVVEERDDAVVISWPTTRATGNQNCLGNLPVTRTVVLERPLGARVVLDGSSYPPTPVGA
jgi:hypothetical protein